MKSIPICSITQNSIDRHPPHVSQMHICTYTQSVYDAEPYTGLYANIYGPLWTPSSICAIWTYFLIILYIFPFLFLSKRHYHSPHPRQSYDRLFSSPQHHVCLHSPIFSYLLHILLLFVRTFSLSSHV